MEITLERFLSSGKKADILFTYRTPETGATSKEALARINPLLRDIGPLTRGRVYSPLPVYAQGMDRLDEIIEEMAAILNPERFPGYRLKFFKELPDKDPTDNPKLSTSTPRYRPGKSLR